MAAGDVVISGHSGRSMRGRKAVWGTVTLDGSNPTPVALAGYLSTVEAVELTLQSSTAPGDDPSWVSVAISGSTANVYAWKNTGGTDPTLVASTNNSAIFQFVAYGKP